MKTKKMAITLQKGLQMTFENGYTVSIQFGYGNYCDTTETELMANKSIIEANNAEIAVWDEDGEFIQMEGWSDSVKGWVSPEDVADFISEVKSWS
jgi:hypothetical protein